MSSEAETRQRLRTKLLSDWEANYAAGGHESFGEFCEERAIDQYIQVDAQAAQIQQLHEADKVMQDRLVREMRATEKSRTALMNHVAQCPQCEPLIRKALGAD